MSRFLLRGLLLLLGASLLMAVAVMTGARRNLAEPYFLEVNRPAASTGGLETCRLLYYGQPRECDDVDSRGMTSLSPDGRWRAYPTDDLRGDWAILRAASRDLSQGRFIESRALSIVNVPVWSLDGHWLAFSGKSTRSPGLDIFRYESQTGEVEQLTTIAGDEWYPAWSADGERIAFNARDPLGTTGLFIMGADGGDLHEALPGLPQSFRPVWSPDGEWLLFQSNCAEEVLRTLGERPCAAAEFNLYLLRLADGFMKPVLTLPGDEYDPAWSPDGAWIAFASRPHDNGNPQIFRVRPDGSDLQPMTNEVSTNYFSPSWARTIDLAWRPLFLLMIALAIMGVVWRTKS